MVQENIGVSTNSSLQKLISGILLGFGALLPLYDKGNTIFLILLVVLAVYLSYTCSLWKSIRENWMLLLIPALLFFIRFLGTTYAINVETGIKETTRALSFLLLPFSFFILKKIQFNNLIKYSFWGLVLGCLVAILICWGNVISLIIQNNEPFSSLFTWKKSNAYLTKVIDKHPPYLGVLILSAVIYLFHTYVHQQKKVVLKWAAMILILIFVIFLFHLVVRNTLLFFVLITFGYLVYFKKWKTLLLGSILFVGISFFVINEGTHYLKRKYYKMLDFSDEKTGDKRFERLEASWNVFKNNPVLGAGMGNVDELRLQEYKKMKDEQAIKQNFNSHNQYMEYLSTFGIVGFLIFIGVLFFLFKRTIVHQEYFLSLLLSLCIFACLTESFLEREVGIKYFSFVAGLIIYKTTYPINKENK